MKKSILLLSFVGAAGFAQPPYGRRDFKMLKGDAATELLRDVARNGKFVLGAHWPTGSHPIQCTLAAYRSTLDGYDRCIIKNIQAALLPNDGTLCNAGTWMKDAVIEVGKDDDVRDFSGLVRVELKVEQFLTLFAKSRSTVECIQMERD